MTPSAVTGSRVLATGSGILAILIWSTSVAVSRSVIEHLGLFTGGGLVHLIGGGTGLLVLLCRRGKRASLAGLSRRYLLGCGALFIVYLPCFYLAMGLAADHQQVVEMGVLNYLWPSLTLVFSVPLLRKRANGLLFPGMLLAFGGVVLAVTGQGPFSWAGVWRHVATNPLPYAAVLTCAVTWALFSNLSRLWAEESDAGAVSVFLMAAGAVLLSMRWFADEHPQWNAETVAELLYAAWILTFLAYEMWDLSMRKGNITLVTALSYLIPLMSIAVSWLYLHVPLPPVLWLASAMVVSGAVLCHRAISDREPGAE